MPKRPIHSLLLPLLVILFLSGCSTLVAAPFKIAGGVASTAGDVLPVPILSTALKTAGTLSSAAGNVID